MISRRLQPNWCIAYIAEHTNLQVINCLILTNKNIAQKKNKTKLQLKLVSNTALAPFLLS